MERICIQYTPESWPACLVVRIFIHKYTPQSWPACLVELFTASRCLVIIKRQFCTRKLHRAGNSRWLTNYTTIAIRLLINMCKWTQLKYSPLMTSQHASIADCNKINNTNSKSETEYFHHCNINTFSIGKLTHACISVSRQHPVGINIKTNVYTVALP